MQTRASRRSQLAPLAESCSSHRSLPRLRPPSRSGYGPDKSGRQAAVVLTTDGFFHAFDTANNQSLASFRVAARGFSSPTPGLAVSPDGSRIYIARPAEEGDAIRRKGTLLVIESATNRLLATIEVGAYPRTVAVSPDGRRVYVTNGSYARVQRDDLRGGCGNAPSGL